MLFLLLLLISSCQSVYHTCAIVHGLHLHVNEWYEQMYGIPDQEKFGRLSKLVQFVSEHNRSMNFLRIILGSGASQIKIGNRLWSESEVIQNVLIKSIDRILDEFSIYQSTSNVKSLILNITTIDTQSKNTYEELSNAGKQFHSIGCQQIVIISGPTHIERCLRDAISIYSSKKYLFMHRLIAVPSDVPYSKTSSTDVIIIEPPHLPNIVSYWELFNKILTNETLKHMCLSNVG